MKKKSKGDMVIEFFSEKIAEGIVKRLPKNSESHIPSPENNQTENYKFLSPTQFSRKYGLPKHRIYLLIRNGNINVFQIEGSSKKYIRDDTIEKIMQRLPIPPKVEDYQSFEKSLRLALKRGQKLNQLIEEFKATENKQSISVSVFSRWLFENGHTECLRGAIIIKF